MRVSAGGIPNERERIRSTKILGREFEAAVRLRPKRGDAHYSLGATWFDLQESAAAVKELRLAISMNPANAAAHQLLAHVLAQQNNLAEAQNEITLALRLRPSAQIHLDLGVVEAQQGNWEDATSHFRRAIVVDPGLAAAHMMLGIALRRQADHKGALSNFELRRNSIRTMLTCNTTLGGS